MDQLPIPNLAKGPFLGSAAVAGGWLTNYELRTAHRAVYRDVYLANDIELTALLRAQAASMFAGPDAVLTGLSAAAVHGTKWLDASAPAEVWRADRRAPPDLRVRAYSLAPQDVCISDGMKLTTSVRTAFDIGRLLPHNEAVPILDALINKTQLDREEVWSLAAKHRGIRGIDRFRLAFAHSNGGSQSPLQSRTRLLLNAACEFPIETQIPFYDQWGLVFARVHMGWPQLKLAVECDDRSDGDIEYRTWMLEHTATLEALRWRLVWVTPLMMSRPSGIFRLVQKAALAASRRLRK